MYECDGCYKTFYSEHARYQHMRDKDHFVYECSICDNTYTSEESCEDHEVRGHLYCRDCDRHFSNYNNIKMHLNSRAHRGQTIDCPFCEKAYTTATGLAHHLETGSCLRAQGLSRDQIYCFVRSKDPNGVISKKLIGWTGSDSYEATSRSWNGDGYECYLCHREFNSLRGLNQHLSSPVHQQALYHCPNRSCYQEFKSLAGIINHLESEACGFTRFETVQRGIHSIVSGDRLIGF